MGKELLTSAVVLIFCSSALLVPPGCSSLEPENLETPVNVLPYARLVASNMEPSVGLWANERYDGIATVTDDYEETSYKPKVGEKNSIRIDFSSVFLRQLPLKSISLVLSGSPPAEISLSFSEACGLEPVKTVRWEAPFAELLLDGINAGCVEMTFLADGPCAFDRIGVLAGGVSEREISYKGDVLVSSTYRPFFGVIEGFYGIPWTWRERKMLLKTMQAFGLGAYLYAPKNDPWHREKWREPYPEDIFENIVAFSKDAQKAKVTVYVGISPFVDFDFQGEEDFVVLARKLEKFAEKGIKGFALLADDIEFETNVVVDGELGKRHADVANRLLQVLRSVNPEASLWFVPTVYSDERTSKWEGGKDYLMSLRALDPSIEVMWTGKGTTSETMSGSDMDNFVSLVGKKPVIWDNYYANDGGDMFFGRILLKVFDGRDKSLLGAVNGVALNLSLQGALSRLSLGTFGAWLEDVQSTKEDKKKKSLEVEAEVEGLGEDDLETLSFFMDCFNAMALDPFPAHKEVEALASQLLKALQRDWVSVVDSARKLLPLLARMYAMPTALYHSKLSSNMVHQAWYPALKMSAEAEMGIFALGALMEKAQGNSGADMQKKAEEAHQRSIVNRYLFGSGVLYDLLERIGALEPFNRGATKPRFVGSEKVLCTPGREVVFPTWDEGEVQVFGLGGAVVNKSRQVLWTPTHSGVWNGIVVVTGENYWDFRFFEAECTEGL